MKITTHANILKTTYKLYTLAMIIVTDNGKIYLQYWALWDLLEKENQYTIVKQSPPPEVLGGSIILLCPLMALTLRAGLTDKSLSSHLLYF